MPLHKLDKMFSSKRTFSIIPKHFASQSKSSQNKQNDFSQIPSTKKYLCTEKQLPEMDQTQKFLAETKQRLHSSSKQLHQFHRKRQAYKSTKQNIDFSILSKQIKATKQKLKNKHFFGIHKQQNKSAHVCINQTDNKSDKNQKLKLIEKVLTLQELNQFKEELTTKQKQIQKQYNGNPDMQEKLSRYYLNYQVISRFLQQVAKDTQKLAIKKQNIELYYRMKQEMIGLLSNQEFFKAHMKDIQQSEQSREKALLTKTIFQQQRFAKTYSRGKNSNGSNEKSLADKIEELLESSKNNIKEAFSNFNKPYLMYEIQLQFNKRLSDASLNQ